MYQEWQTVWTLGLHCLLMPIQGGQSGGCYDSAHVKLLALALHENH